jgi:hypothetical protein
MCFNFFSFFSKSFVVSGLHDISPFLYDTQNCNLGYCKAEGNWKEDVTAYKLEELTERH